MAFARLVTHYWRHGHWLDDRPVLVDEAGRDTGDAGMAEAMIATTDRFVH
jgi:hypothetical protein